MWRLRLRRRASGAALGLVAVAALVCGQTRAGTSGDPPAADAFTAPSFTPSPDRPLYLALDAPPPSLPTNDWRIEIPTWIWLIGIEGNIGVGGGTVDVSADFVDILHHSDSLFALSGRVEVGKGRWGAYVDGIFADLGVNDASGPNGLVDVDVTSQLAVVDFGLMYRIGEWAPHGRAAGNRHHTTLDLYAGGRYTFLDLELAPARLDTRSRSTEWIDPIVGAKLVLPLTEKWHASINGDIGGFGVGSDFTWSATAVAGYDFKLFKFPATAYLGYRAIGQDFSEGNGTRAFRWDVILHGPIFGLAIKL